MRDRVIAKIDEFNAAGRIFTAYDVTQTLRSDDPASAVRHHEVRRLVWGLFNAQDPCFDGMLCTPVLIGQDQDVARCYHQPGQDANDHPAVYRAPDVDDDDDDDFPVDPLRKPVLDTSPSGFSPALVTPAAISADTVLIAVESNGRLNVPSAIIRGSLGLGPGDDVMVNVETGRLVITYADSPTGYVLTVSVRGNIRISQRLLQKIARCGHTVFRCTATDGRIVIES